MWAGVPSPLTLARTADQAQRRRRAAVPMVKGTVGSFRLFFFAAVASRLPKVFAFPAETNPKMAAYNFLPKIIGQLETPIILRD